MHIDLNSCFAIVEQQANPLYRNKPLAVAAYDTPRGMVIASSYEAKARGIKLGVNVGEARQLDPEVIVLMPDPPKYRYAHTLFRGVLQEYTSHLHAKSIDEFVLDFTATPGIRDKRDLVDVGYEIKHKVKDKVGGYVTVNVGIGTNRFWAKTAAGLNKPDGLDVMDATNALKIYKNLKLTDLTGINYRYEARLNSCGIFTPAELFKAGERRLHKQVFKSIVGRQWYARLRGWEVDDVIWGRKSVGHNYAIGKKTADRQEIARLLMKLCHKVGRRMRHQGFTARGVHLTLGFRNGYWWSRSYDTRTLTYSTGDIYYHARKLLHKVPITDLATHLSVSVYHLEPADPEQMSLFGGTNLDKRALTDAADTINDRYGNYTLVPAEMAGMDELIIDRIAFGSVKDYLD